MCAEEQKGGFPAQKMQTKIYFYIFEVDIMLKFKISAFADEFSSNIDEQIDALRQNGVKMIEVRNIGQKNAMELTPKAIGEVAKKIKASGLTVSSLGSQIGRLPITEDPKKHFDALKKACENALTLETNRIRVFSFATPAGEHEKYKEEVIDRMGRMLDIADNYGLKLCHENESGIYGNTAEHCLDLFEVFGTRLGCVFDPCNFIYNDTIPFPNGYELLKKYITYVHVKDCVKATGIIVPAGRGNGGIPEFFATLNNTLSGEMILTVEPHLKAYSDLAPEDLERYIQAGAAYPTYADKFEAAINYTRYCIPRTAECI